MSTPRVLNRRKVGVPAGAVDVSRTSPWGNPFRVGKDGNRNEVIDKFEDWLRGQPLLVQRAKRVLRGKDLVCYCSPKKCHAEIWLKIANG